MTNERLRDAISAHGLTSVKLAERVAVDPKTVERWIATDRVPHRTHRGAVASVVGIDESYLWPSIAPSGRVKNADDSELVTLYGTRGSVPGGLWLMLVNQARTSIDTLMFAGLFLTDAGPEISEALARQARSGVRVRIMLGDPILRLSPSEAAKRASETVSQHGSGSGRDTSKMSLAPMVSNCAGTLRRCTTRSTDATTPCWLMRTCMARWRPRTRSCTCAGHRPVGCSTTTSPASKESGRRQLRRTRRIERWHDVTT